MFTENTFCIPRPGTENVHGKQHGKVLSCADSVLGLHLSDSEIHNHRNRNGRALVSKISNIFELFDEFAEYIRI